MKKTVSEENGIFRYPVSRPSLPDLGRLHEEMVSIWKSGQVTVGRHVRAFEEAVEKKLGVRHAVAVSSGTSGLILAGQALGITGEVIVPAFASAATAHAVTWNRTTPVFCDSEPGTFTLDFRKIEKKITRKTSAIMPASVFGIPPRGSEFEELAHRHRLRLLFDSSQALGAKVNGTYVGGFGDVEVFSLGTDGVVTAIEGGMATTNDEVLAKRIRQMRDYGKADGGEDMAYVGLSARMSELHAAVGLANFNRMSDLIRERRELVTLYKRLLAGLPGVRFQEVPGDVSPSYNYMVVFVDGSGGVTRDTLFERLKEEGIQTKRYFYPAVHNMTAYRIMKRKYPGKLLVAEKASRESLALPLYGDLKKEDVEFICSRVREVF
ncbi:MAG: DegT/DnrJ/EryC1/StrS family aminotransferase [Thermodesulfobacteriota bacterium]|nr:DegT/DnrJ/EryC1/StrS family aminotransferase [Thermodesulfobacteriota bacterium]